MSGLRQSLSAVASEFTNRTEHVARRAGMVFFLYCLSCATILLAFALLAFGLFQHLASEIGSANAALLTGLLFLAVGGAIFVAVRRRNRRADGHQREQLRPHATAARPDDLFGAQLVALATEDPARATALAFLAGLAATAGRKRR